MGITFTACTRVGFDFNFKLLGLKAHVEGAENLNEIRPCVFVSNHQSSLDLFAM